MEEIYTSLRQLQKDSGRSIRAIAKDMGTSAAHLHRVLKGEVSPTVYTIARFARAIGKTASFIFVEKEKTQEEVIAQWLDGSPIVFPSAA